MKPKRRFRIKKLFHYWILSDFREDIVYYGLSHEAMLREIEDILRKEAEDFARAFSRWAEAPIA